MALNYNNMQRGDGRVKFVIRYLANILRTWIVFHIRYPWVKYDGFVRVMHGTSFAKMKIKLGRNVQFGRDCLVASDLTVGNNVLFAARVSVVGKCDHNFSVAGQTIWDGAREDLGPAVVDDDVWLGHGVTLVGPVRIGKGAVVAAGALVTKDVPPCEIWGGVPARKLSDRFDNEENKQKHLTFLG